MSAGRHMLHALELAKRGLGNVWPNPAVGCVIVKPAVSDHWSGTSREGLVIGRGWTQPGGRPHAEAMALAQAGDNTRGADLYVTLEPCCHPGRGPACTDTIIAAGIQKVFIAMGDPHSRVNGQGIAALRAAGIEVEVGVCATEANELNKGFLLNVTDHRPMVILKMAVSKDWKMTTGDAAQSWITGEIARRHGHLLRATHDAILIGVGTVIADDPMLDCRIAGLEKSSLVRVVLDRHSRMPQDSKLMQTADQIPLWILKENTIPEVLKTLAGKGITRLLVEGGRQVAQSFLDAGVVDKIVIYQAPHEIGDAGLSAPELPKNISLKSEIQLGNDTVRHYVVR